jgi:hypothetical protein
VRASPALACTVVVDCVVAGSNFNTEPALACAGLAAPIAASARPLGYGKQPVAERCSCSLGRRSFSRRLGRRLRGSFRRRLGWSFGSRRSFGRLRSLCFRGASAASHGHTNQRCDQYEGNGLHVHLNAPSALAGSNGLPEIAETAEFAQPLVQRAPVWFPRRSDSRRRRTRASTLALASDTAHLARLSLVQVDRVAPERPNWVITTQDRSANTCCMSARRVLIARVAT